ncbi:unnamed protein product [Closterium sp. NIES-64]|nr:unnamed protein product [Closterium sp. NIES-64]
MRSLPAAALAVEGRPSAAFFPTAAAAEPSAAAAAAAAAAAVSPCTRLAPASLEWRSVGCSREVPTDGQRAGGREVARGGHAMLLLKMKIVRRMRRREDGGRG